MHGERRVVGAGISPRENPGSLANGHPSSSSQSECAETLLLMAMAVLLLVALVFSSG